MTRMRLAALALVLCAAGCQHTVTGRPATLQHTAVGDRATGNRQATVTEARRLVLLARLPPGARATSERPAGLDGPALGTPETSSLVDEHRYWYVDRSLDSVWTYLKAHPPAGLQQSGTASSEGPDGLTSEGLAWSEANRSFATDLQLDVSIARAAHGGGTVVRADGMGEWLDPRPVPDRAPGPRLRITLAGGCPHSVGHAVGVTNTGDELARQLLPSPRPTGAVICEYAGTNGTPPSSLGRSARVDAAAAARIADAFTRLPIAHTDGGVVNCPMDDGSITVVALAYPGRTAVDLWAETSGCSAVSNGWIVVAGHADLSRWIAASGYTG